VQTTTRGNPPIESSAPVPRGTFDVPIPLPQQQSSRCLAKVNESVAWQCASNINFQVNVLPSPDNSTTTTVTIESIPKTDSNATYHGQQAPNFRSVELERIVTDLEPTYYFRTTYDRIVLLNENQLASAKNPQAPMAMSYAPFEPGDTPWRCIFNDTTLEGYLYPQQNTTAYGASDSNPDTGRAFRFPKIPHVLKLVEQRVPNGNRPYCERMLALADGTLEPIEDSTVMLNVAYTGTGTAAARVKSAKFRARQQNQPANTCFCQWTVQ
jgi:hypothetical protein